MKLESERIYIRKFDYGDEFDLFEMCNDVETAYLAGWQPHKNLAVSRNVTFNYLAGDETFAIIEKGTRKLIGTISLYRKIIRKDVNCRELGFCLNQKYRGKGYMKEAVKLILGYGFKKLKLDMIYSYTMTDNIASYKVLEANHFQYEGTLRKFRKLFTGEVIDVRMYSLLKEEWKEVVL